MRRKKKLADLLVETYPNIIDLKTHLMFIQMISSSIFGEYFSGFISNVVLSKKFVSLFACKLDDYLCRQAENVNETVQNLENYFFWSQK